MNSDELLEAIEDLDDEGIVAEETQKKRYFIFRVGKMEFALFPESIKEIMTDLTIYPVPACPRYISGLINCHGQPYTVFDLAILLLSEELPVRQFLVLEIDKDHLAFACTEVIEITEIPVASVTMFSEKDPNTRFFDSLIDLPERKIPVLSVRSILSALEQELAI